MRISVCIHISSPVWTSHPFHLSGSSPQSTRWAPCAIYSRFPLAVCFTHDSVCLMAVISTEKSGLDPPWNRKWQPMPGFLPSKLHGQRSLAGCSPWGHEKSGMTEQLSTVYICQPQYSSSPAPIAPPPVHMSTLYLCISTPALQRGSSLPCFWFHIYALTEDICFSDLLHSVW